MGMLQSKQVTYQSPPYLVQSGVMGVGVASAILFDYFVKQNVPMLVDAPDEVMTAGYVMLGFILHKANAIVGKLGS